MAEPGADQAGERIEALLDELAASSDPAVPDQVAELVRSVLGLHAAGLSRLVAGLDWEVLRDLAADDEVASLLLLHDLHPVPLAARVDEALAVVRPDLGLDSKDVRIARVDTDGVAHLELGPGCRSAATVLSHALRSGLLDAVPDLTDVVIAQPPPEPPVVQLLPTRRREAEGRR